jgi:hypothetical protein
MSILKKLFTAKITIALVILFPLVTAPKVQADNTVQRECFLSLQKSVLETPSFAPVHDQVRQLQYENVEVGFSKYYRNISSFGIDLRSPDFDMRLYSFGDETGYQHPPFSAFPTYTLSEKWEEPAKQFIVAEEYVRNAETNERVFLSCAFMVIDANSLKKVTAEDYLYDGPLSSVLYLSPDSSYKVWYSKNKSYNHNNEHFVTWERMFVYPKSTQNDYFDRYSVADTFPTRKTTALQNIVDSKNDLMDGSETLLDAPELTGYDTVFMLNSYYQAIENAYPKFAQKLALRGVLQYSTVKELLATRGVSEFSSLWNSVLDSREITKYALLKEKGLLVEDNNDGVVQANEKSLFFEEQLLKIKNLTLEQEAQNLLKTVTERNPIVESTATPDKNASFVGITKTYLYIGGGILLLGLAGLLVWLRKRRQEIQDITS